MLLEYTRSDWRTLNFKAEEGKEVIHRRTTFYFIPSRGRRFCLELDEQKATEDESLNGCMMLKVEVKEFPATILKASDLHSWFDVLPPAIRTVVPNILDANGALRNDAIGATFRYLSLSDTRLVYIRDGPDDIFACFRQYFESIGERPAF